MDITVPATIRPTILNRTLGSFTKHMLEKSSHDFKLILNVDPAGEDRPVWDVVNVADKYFAAICLRMPDVPNFADAMKWLWSQVTSEFFINLEDDWEMQRTVDLDAMVQTMKDEPDLAILRLPFSDAGVDKAKQWNKWFPWNGRYFECPQEMRGGLGFCGHPSLIRTEFIEQVAPLLLTDRCPEKQIKHHYPRMGRILNGWRFGVFQKQTESKAVVDIGRDWRVSKGFIKDGNSSFIRWRT